MNTFSNTAGNQLDEKGREIIRKQITNEMTCSICGSLVFLVSMTDGDTIACTSKPFEHRTGFIIDYENETIIKESIS